MYTLLNLKTDIKGIVFPDGEAPNLVVPHNKFVVDVLVELQQFVECLQQDNTDIFPHCSTYYNCGMTVFDAPRGIIKSVGVIDKLDPDTLEEDAAFPDDYCSYIPYSEVEYCHVRRYLDVGVRGGCCLDPVVFYGLTCGRIYPTPTDAGVPAGLPPLQLGYHYPQASTNREWGRAGGGVWAKDRGKIYLAPWIQSSESVIVKWDGIKRVWSDGDPVDDDPLLIRAVEEYVRWKHAEKYDHELSDAASAKAAYEETRALLIHQCREETRARECESSHARSSPPRVLSLYYNDEQTVTVGCPEGMTGDSVTVTIIAGTVGSSISKEDANAKAAAQATSQAQDMLDCSETPETFWNSTDYTYTLPCHGDEEHPPVEGSGVTVTIHAGTVSGSTQAEADNNAIVAAQQEAIVQMGLQKPCTWWNKEVSYTAHCPPPNEAVTYTYTVPEHMFPSDESQAEADGEALHEAQEEAQDYLNTHGLCAGVLFWNTEQYATPVTITGIFTPGGIPCSVTVSVRVSANSFSNNVSVGDANSDAYAFAIWLRQIRLNQYVSTYHCGVYHIIYP